VATKREWYIAGDDAEEDIYGGHWTAQTFTIGTTGVNQAFNITSIKIFGDRTHPNVTPSNMYAAIKAVDGDGKPTGNDLSTGVISANAWQTIPVWHTINMSECELAAGTQYALILKSPSSDSYNCNEWRFDTSAGSYAGGSRLWSTDSGASWNLESGDDMLFEIWGEPVPKSLAGEIIIGSTTAGALKIIMSLVGEVVIGSAISGVFGITKPLAGEVVVGSTTSGAFEIINIILEKNKLQSKAAWLILLEITLNDSGSTVLRFVRNFEDVIFGGETYTAFSFEIEPTVLESKGQIPTVTLRVNNITRLMESYLQDLDGAIGSEVKITVVNSDYLTGDYSELELTYDVLACESTAQWVVFTLGAPSPLRQRFPLEKYLALHCHWRFESVECGYDNQKSIEGITLPSGSEVSVEITGHPFSTDDSVKFADVGGTTKLNDYIFTITKTDADNFTLNNTDGDDFTAWTSEGTAGFATCKRTLADCRIRENATRFGGFPGMRSGGVRIA